MMVGDGPHPVRHEGFLPGGVAPIMMDKYVIGKDHQIYQIVEDGTKRLQPADLDGAFFRGSILCVQDMKPRTFISGIIYLWQKLHSWVTGRRLSLPAEIGHAAIILNRGVDTKGPLPFQMAHSWITGIQTTDKDYLVDNDVTDLIIYRPRNADFREEVAKRAEQTAQTVVRNPYGLWDALMSQWHFRKHDVCERRGGEIPDSVQQRTAGLIADALLNSQIFNEQGRPEPLYCSAYVMTVLQGSWIRKALKDMVSQGRLSQVAIDQFLKNGDRLCERDELINKIVHAIQTEHPESLSDVGQAIHGVYRTHKVVRMESRYMLPQYLHKLDRLAGILHAPPG